MSHLSRDERLLALDGGLGPERQAHLGACPACRGDVDALGGVLARLRTVDVPEPSPLFWDHLATRVSDAIARETAMDGKDPASAPASWWTPRWAWAAVAVVVIVAGSAFLTSARLDLPPPAVAETRTAPAAPAPLGASTIVDGADREPGAEPDDDSWDLIAAVADEHTVEALAPQVGQSELSISALSDEERAALAGELRAMLPPGVREG